MKYTTRQRAVRVILSSILDSDLSISELRELAGGLLDDKEFLLDICSALEETTRILSKHGYRAKLPDDPAQQDWVREMQGLVKKKRLSKRELIGTLAAIDPDLATDYLHGSQTLTEILRFVSEIAPKTVLQELRTRLQSDPGSGDEYLKGIMKR